LSGDTFDWKLEKAEELQRERGISFEEIVALIEDGRAVARIPHLNQVDYPRQEVFVVDVDGYLWAVPADRRRGGWTLRTAFPSRLLMKRYGRR